LKDSKEKLNENKERMKNYA